jgi:hypothetical protein
MPYLNDKQPVINGLAVGTSRQNVTAYVGRGWYSGKGGNFYPGRIQVDTGKLFIDFNNTEISFTQELEYLVIPAGCACSYLPPAVAVTRDGVITNPGPYNYMTGRVNLANGRVEISSVEFSSFTQYYLNSNGTGVHDTATEVLVCESTAPTNVRPTVTLSSAACAGWKSYKNDNLPTFNGLFAGTSWNNKAVYVGRGYYENQFQPGRVQTDGQAGIYVSSYYTEETFLVNRTEYLVLSVGCSCEWAAANANTLLRPGLVHSPDENYHFVVGRKNLTNSRVAISKLRPTIFWEYYNIDAGSHSEGTAAVVLVCEKV